MADYDTNQEPSESIYNIVERIIPDPPKPPMYRSKHNGMVPPSTSTFKCTGTSRPGVQNVSGQDTQDLQGGHHKYVKPSATLGPVPGTSKVDPKDWKKIAEERKIKSAEQVRKTEPKKLVPSKLKDDTRKPGVPRTSDKPVMNLVTTKNFIVANAVEAILAAPANVKEDPPNYKEATNYGKVPVYLTKIKQEIADEYEYIQKLQQEEEEQRSSKVKEISPDDQKELVDGLKGRWETVNKIYQGQTHLTKLDTLGKIRRKETCEKELAQLEKDIQKMSKPRIYVDTTM